MVDPGEVIKTTLKREFMEEAMNSLEANKPDLEEMERKIDEFFSNHTSVYIYMSFFDVIDCYVGIMTDTNTS